MKRFLAIFCVTILMLAMMPVAVQAAAEQTPSGIPIEQVEAFVDRYMDRFIGITTPGAAIVLVKDGRIVFSKGYGYADIEQRISVDSRRTVFEYGSISKVFVYMTIMRLVEQGRLDLNADIRAYLPDEFRNRLQFDKPITMLNIMNHTAGFEDFLFDVILTRTHDLPEFEQTLLDNQPIQAYEPGTVVAYSNYAVALAAYAAQRMLGQDFHAYLRETVFDRLGMDSASAHPMLSDRPELAGRKASGYMAQSTGGFRRGSWSYIPLYPVGSVNGTAEDLAKFAMSLLPEDGESSPLFEQRSTMNDMFTRTIELGPGISGFAHGFIEFDGAQRAIGHGGNTAFFTAQFNLVPKERFGVIVLTNAASEMHVTAGLTEALIGKRNLPDTGRPTGSPNDNIKGALPDAANVSGTYIAARRMHRSFLELYGYLALLDVKAIDANTIRLDMGGQTSSMVQTRPYTFERVAADGAIFEYHFDPVHFLVDDGRVVKMSGDYMPLPPGRTWPWLIASILIVVLGALYLLSVPVIMATAGIVSRIRKIKPSDLNRRDGRALLLMHAAGAALLMNNGIMILRMLANNYRSFSEFRVQVVLNYPLALVAFISIAGSVLHWKQLRRSSALHRVLRITSAVVLALVIGTLANWHFFQIVA